MISQVRPIMKLEAKWAQAGMMDDGHKEHRP
jgi:hypothetical protein